MLTGSFSGLNVGPLYAVGLDSTPVDRTLVVGDCSSYREAGKDICRHPLDAPSIPVTEERFSRLGTAEEMAAAASTRVRDLESIFHKAAIGE